ncbi:MAG: DUF2085 domain-containing protein [Chloroflexota bacterium]|nr:DUF2085 domain-containing protein [Chloroflexota bacterium]
MTAGVFLLLPGDPRHKAHAVLQGVCAQRPSHSFQFSGQPLPVDSRMTGIYLGAASSLLWYLLVCRARHSGRFTRGVWIGIVLCIGAMAIDGLNSLAADLAIPTPYETTNLARLVTGLLSGVAIGALLSHLATISLTHRPRGGWPPAPAATLAPPLVFGAFVCALAASGLAPLAAPFTCLIVGSALAVLWTMTSVVLALALQRGWGFPSARQRDETLAIAFVGASVLLVGLAAFRVLLEQFAGPLKLP